MNENKFDGMGKLYAKYRPSYPREFIDYLFLSEGVSEKSVIADFVGALKMVFDRYSRGGVLIMPNLTRSYIGKL